MNIETLSFVPEQLKRICLEDPTNVKKMANIVTDLAFENKAFRVLIETRFNFSFEDDSFIRFFSDYGIKQFRNELALCYLSYAMDKSFYSKSAQNYLDEILSVEEELFEFIPRNDYKPFLLLFHLKNHDIEARKEGINQFLNNYDFHEIKKLLAHYKPNLQRTDWLIVLLKSFLDIYSANTQEVILKNKGKFFEILSSVTEDQKSIIINNHLSYGQSINDSDYFLFNKV